MKKITILILLVVTTAFSQETIEKELGPFKELKVFSGLVVHIKKADVPRIEITGKKREDVVIKNIDERLKLSMRFPDTFNGDEVEIKLYYADNLFLIDVNEGATVGTKETIKQQSIEIKVQEGAMINIPVDVKYIKGKVVSGGQIYIKGTVESQNIELNTGGVYKGYDLISNQAYVSSSSGAIAQLFVKEMLDAKVSLGGTVYYKGNPNDIMTKKTSGGTIKSEE